MSKIIESVVSHILRQRERLGLITSDLQKQSEREKLTEVISSSDILLKPNIQSGKTDVIKVNEDFSNIELDLLLNFERMNTLFDVLDSHKKLNASLINNMKTNMAVLNDKVMSLADTVDKLSNNIVHVESFRNIDSFEQNPLYYTAENGDVVTEQYHVMFDKVNECIRMPKALNVNKLIAPNGQRMASVSINKQIGEGLSGVKNPNNAIDKCIDTSMDTYWEETILADTPIKVRLDERYYNHYFGALCELEITFNSIIEINEISLYPFGSYPLDVVAIRYYTTDEPDKEEDALLLEKGHLHDIEILSPYASIKPMQINTSTSVQFEAVAAKRIRIILNQQHYIRNTFIYDKKDVRKNNMWFDAQSDVKFETSDYQKGVYDLKSKTDASWSIFNHKTRPLYKTSTLDIQEFLFPTKQELKQVTKYEYSYGLYNIGVNENNYRDVGVYVSKPIKIDQNIGSVELSVDEVLPDDNYSINYYVSFSDEPEGDDWTRVYPNTSLNLKKLLESNELDFKMAKERYFGSRGKALTLEHVPYINHGNPANSNISITITDNGDIISEGAGIENVTNYIDPSESYKNFSASTDVIQYYFYKDKVFFNKPISEDCAIDIQYKHFINSVRLKAILKRATEGSVSLSAILNQYVITFKPIA